ncbi:MAG: hypothetical protein MJZ47_04925 [Bacteroidales bacterium]|nr:hypothetical protein [Bacteroidales bacterium]
MAQYKNFPRWKAGVIFAFLQWFASSVLVLILHPTSDRFENIIEAGIYAIAAGILYVLFTWFIGEKMKTVKVDVPVAEEQKEE